MAAAQPQVSGNDNPSLAKECLAFIQALVNQEIGFNFQLTSGSFSCSFDNNGKRTMNSAQTPTVVKYKSPSARKRNARRRQQFLENKKFGHSSADCEQLDHVESTQPHSESICAPSSEEVQKVSPLKVLVNNQSSPKYRLQQFDGACSLSDEDADISRCDDNRQSEHDDPKMGQSTSCPNCDQHLSFFHQCQDPDTQTNIDNFHPKNGHSEETGKDRILDFEREYLANYPDLPEDYEKWKENFFATSRFSNDSKLAHTVLSVAWLTSTDRKK